MGKGERSVNQPSDEYRVMVRYRDEWVGQSSTWATPILAEEDAKALRRRIGVVSAWVEHWNGTDWEEVEVDA
jgi:hypothetical protein